MVSSVYYRLSPREKKIIKFLQSTPKFYTPQKPIVRSKIGLRPNRGDKTCKMASFRRGLMQLPKSFCHTVRRNPRRQWFFSSLHAPLFILFDNKMNAVRYSFFFPSSFVPTSASCVGSITPLTSRCFATAKKVVSFYFVFLTIFCKKKNQIDPEVQALVDRIAVLDPFQMIDFIEYFRVCVIL